ncbi:RNA 2',3'-cyclic phosphodiesterase [uncultured archaeon]|nr:RNA 2',3'-cyclic phosphodiesterase [uncultured archaeon]
MASYVLVYLIEGKAKRYHQALSKEISKKFNVKNPSDRIVPHITIKFIGNLNNKNQVKELIRKINETSFNLRKFEFTLEGFNNFDRRVLFIDVKKIDALQNAYQEVYSRIIKLPFIKKVPKFEGKNMHFHATLCIDDIEKKFDKIKNYLSNRNPVYEVYFNNLALMKKENNERWKPIKIWRIK